MYRGMSPEEQSCVLLGRARKVPDYKVFLSVGFFLKNSLMPCQDSAGLGKPVQAGVWIAVLDTLMSTCCRWEDGQPVHRNLGFPAAVLCV